MYTSWMTWYSSALSFPCFSSFLVCLALSGCSLMLMTACSLSLPLIPPNYTRRKEIHTREQQCHAVPIWTNRMVPCELHLVFHAVIWLITQWYSITWIWDDWTTTLFWVNSCHFSPLHCQVPSVQTMYMTLTTYHPNTGLDPPYPTKHTHHNHITLTNSYWDKSLILVHQSTIFNDNLHLSPPFYRASLASQTSNSSSFSLPSFSLPLS